jgi:hypothetical protein
MLTVLAAQFCPPMPVDEVDTAAVLAVLKPSGRKRPKPLHGCEAGLKL